MHGVWYGSDKDTNNEAECQALVNLLETLAGGSWLQGASEILIVGNSQLINTLLHVAHGLARPVYFWL